MNSWKCCSSSSLCSFVHLHLHHDAKWVLFATVGRGLTCQGDACAVGVGSVFLMWCHEWLPHTEMAICQKTAGLLAVERACL